MKLDKIEAFITRTVDFFRKGWIQFKNKISSKFNGSKAKKGVLHIESLGYYYWRIVSKSRLSRKIRWFYKNKFKPFWANFNLLNSIFHRAAIFMRFLHCYKTANFLDGAMQEKAGINRDVFYRYLLKELLLYFFVKNR